MAPLRDRGRSSLLAVFAHPDDESLACGGLLARCAADGVRVSLLCLTKGGHGPDERTGMGDAKAGLATVRAQELSEAARVLGIDDVTVLDHEDGMLSWIDAGLLESDVADAIRRARADVVVTFDEDGLYWHPDHIAVHERVTSTVAALAEDAPALFYTSLPPGAMRALVGAAATDPTGDERLLGVTDPDAFGSAAPSPTVVLDVGAYAARKLTALRCHRTQVAGGAFDRLDERDAPRHLGIEHFRRATVGARGETFIERLGAAAAVRS